MSNDRRTSDVTGKVTNYPERWAREVVADDGALVSLRAIRSNDAAALVHFHDRLSSRSIYRRYFSLHPRLSEGEVQHLTVVDYVNRFAYVVERSGELIGVGRFDRVPDTSEAEVAFVVADEFHRQGVGLMLLAHLAEVARSLGITTFTAETQADNRSMMGVFRSSGFTVTSTLRDEVISARLALEPTDASRASRARRSARVDAPSASDPPC